MKDPVILLKFEFGVRRISNSKRKAVDYFVRVENNKVIFTTNPMEAFTYHSQEIANTIASVLEISDKKNKFQSFKITIE